jgi:Flp pilus assembly protein TadB
MRLGTHATGWVCSRTHRGGVSVELALAAASARTKGDVFFEVAAVVEEVEARATDALDGVLTSDRDHHR